MTTYIHLQNTFSWTADWEILYVRLVVGSEISHPIKKKREEVGLLASVYVYINKVVIKWS